MKQILDFLKKGEYRISLGWIDKTTFGEIHLLEKRIRINDIFFIVHTFVHEYLHAKHPTAPEEVIQWKTQSYINRMTVAQIANLYQKILEVAI